MVLPFTLWPRKAFTMKPGGLDLVADEQRTFGFGANGGRIRARSAYAGGGPGSSPFSCSVLAAMSARNSTATETRIER